MDIDLFSMESHEATAVPLRNKPGAAAVATTTTTNYCIYITETNSQFQEVTIIWQLLYHFIIRNKYI
jgi:hypothetical protein